MNENKTVEYEIIDNIGIIKGMNPLLMHYLTQ